MGGRSPSNRRQRRGLWALSPHSDEVAVRCKRFQWRSTRGAWTSWCHGALIDHRVRDERLARHVKSLSVFKLKSRGGGVLRRVSELEEGGDEAIAAGSGTFYSAHAPIFVVIPHCDHNSVGA